VVTRNRCCKERVNENREVSHFRPVVTETKNSVVPDWDLDTNKGSLLWLFVFSSLLMRLIWRIIVNN